MKTSAFLQEFQASIEFFIHNEGGIVLISLTNNQIIGSFYLLSG
jgi:hypothetical protein